jgi:hypothetical protein
MKYMGREGVVSVETAKYAGLKINVRKGSHGVELYTTWNRTWLPCGDKVTLITEGDMMSTWYVGDIYPDYPKDLKMGDLDPNLPVKVEVQVSPLIEEYLQKEKELSKLRERIQSIFIHPSKWSNVAHDHKKYLSENGWVCTETMVPVEGYHGFGSVWMKECTSEERDAVKKELDRIEEYLTTNDNE